MSWGQCAVESCSSKSSAFWCFYGVLGHPGVTLSLHQDIHGLFCPETGHRHP